MTKEEIYDEKVNPLMTEILGICETNGIAMVSSFHMGEACDEAPVLVTSLLSDGNGEFDKEFLQFTKDIGAQ